MSSVTFIASAMRLRRSMLMPLHTPFFLMTNGAIGRVATTNVRGCGFATGVGVGVGVGVGWAFAMPTHATRITIGTRVLRFMTALCHGAFAVRSPLLRLLVE